jgi:hypothetical protein
MKSEETEKFLAAAQLASPCRLCRPRGRPSRARRWRRTAASRPPFAERPGAPPQPHAPPPPSPPCPLPSPPPEAIAAPPPRRRSPGLRRRPRPRQAFASSSGPSPRTAAPLLSPLSLVPGPGPVKASFGNNAQTVVVGSARGAGRVLGMAAAGRVLRMVYPRLP